MSFWTWLPNLSVHTPKSCKNCRYHPNDKSIQLGFDFSMSSIFHFLCQFFNFFFCTYCFIDIVKLLKKHQLINVVLAGKSSIYSIFMLWDSFFEITGYSNIKYFIDASKNVDIIRFHIIPKIIKLLFYNHLKYCFLLKFRVTGFEIWSFSFCLLTRLFLRKILKRVRSDRLWDLGMVIISFHSKKSPF